MIKKINSIKSVKFPGRDVNRPASFTLHKWLIGRNLSRLDCPFE